MKYLVLMRHAKSSWKDGVLLDHQRPLNKRGKRDALRMGRYIGEQGLFLDALLCSTALRARETEEGFLQEFPFKGDVQYWDDLYHGGPEAILSLLVNLPDEFNTVMVIGHNPDFDYFLESVCGASEHMPTACVAYIRFPIDRWVDLREGASGELIRIWRPREI